MASGTCNVCGGERLPLEQVIEHLRVRHPDDYKRWERSRHVDMVTYADHVAAVAEAEQRKDREWLATIHDSHLYSLGQRDAIAKAIAAVKGLATERELRSPSAIYVDLRDVTDRITAVGGE